MATRFYDWLNCKTLTEGLDVDWWSKYAISWTFASEEEARKWVVDKMLSFKKQWPSVHTETDDQINKEALAMPLYKQGNKFKIGKRIRKPRFSWEDLEIKPNSLQVLCTAGYINWADGPKLSAIKMVRISAIHPNEHVNSEHVLQLFNDIKNNDYFQAIVVDEQGSVVDGHHRLEVAKNFFKFKMIPVQIISYSSKHYS